MDGARDFIRMNVMYGFGCNARTCVDSAILAMSNKLDEMRASFETIQTSLKVQCVCGEWKTGLPELQ